MLIKINNDESIELLFIQLSPDWNYWVTKCDITEMRICEIMGFVVILYFVPKISEFAPIDGEILASLCSDNCMQILQKPILEDLYGVLNNYLCARIRYK